MFEKEKIRKKNTLLPIPSKFGRKEVTCNRFWPIMCLGPAPILFWASPKDFQKKNVRITGEVFVAAFANNESFYRRISTKCKSNKLFWRVLEDNKQNKRENRGRKHWESLPSIPRAGNVWHKILFKPRFQTQWIQSRWAFCLQRLSYFDVFYQWIHVYLFLTRYFAEKLKNKAFFESKYRSRGDAQVSTWLC